MFTGSDIARPRIPMAKALVAAAAVALGVAGTFLFFVFDPNKFSLFPPCMFHEMTGLDCPGCGAQRALHQLLHGHLIAALRLNAMFVISLPVLAVFGPRWAGQAWRGEPVRIDTKWLWVYLAVWLAFSVLRNLPVPIFAWFAA